MKRNTYLRNTCSKENCQWPSPISGHNWYLTIELSPQFPVARIIIWFPVTDITPNGAHQRHGGTQDQSQAQLSHELWLPLPLNYSLSPKLWELNVSNSIDIFALIYSPLCPGIISFSAAVSVLIAVLVPFWYCNRTSGLLSDRHLRYQYLPHWL